jgi:hypothetical protein
MLEITFYILVTLMLSLAGILSLSSYRESAELDKEVKRVNQKYGFK